MQKGLRSLERRLGNRTGLWRGCAHGPFGRSGGV